jgi:hypothetical protein
VTRPYFVVWGPNTLQASKYRLSGVVIRAALFSLWVMGSAKEDEAEWSSRAALERDLAADLHVDDLNKVSSWVDRLIELRWLDVTPSGGVRLHEWGYWQPALPKSGAERTRRWRESRTDVSRGDSRDAGDATSSHPSPVTPGEERIYTVPSLRDGTAGDASPAPRKPRAPSARQTVHAWLTDHRVGRPVGYVNATLNELIRAYGAGPVIAQFEEAEDLGMRVAKQYVTHAENNLAPIPLRGQQRAAETGKTRTFKEIDHAIVTGAPDPVRGPKPR